MVYSPQTACEITMQPIRRFAMDGAILFSDILVIPQALGQNLEFKEGEGPKLNPIEGPEGLKNLDADKIDETLNPVYETVKLIKQQLSQEGFDQTALIGFAGAPWTVACYMIEGGGSKNFENIRKWAYAEDEGFDQLVEILIVATIHYLSRQIEAGAETVQIFDSWAGITDETNFRKWIIEPTRKIVSALKTKHPGVPVIGFPRMAGVLASEYAEKTGIDMIGTDYTLPISWSAQNLQGRVAVQGNLDPVYLLTGGDPLKKAALRILDDLSSGPFVFNLGHGVIKETPPENVEFLAKIIREYRR